MIIRSFFFFIPCGIINLFRTAFQGGTGKGVHKSLLLFLWAVGYPILAMLIAPNARHHNRYMMPLIPLYMLLAASGFYYVLSLMERYVSRIELISLLGKYMVSMRQIAMALLALVVGVAVFLSVSIWSHRFASDVQNINHQQVAMGKWVKEHIPGEYTIALSDIGAITYVSGRKRIIDMVGLVNPELIASLEESKEGYDNALLHFLHREKADYIITHPNCYPQLVEEKDVLEEIHSIELSRYSGISAGQTMTVYKTHWDNVKRDN